MSLCLDLLLVHQGVVVLELETELEPGPLIVVVLDRLRSKLQDFCDVRCHRVCSTTMRKFYLLSDTTDDQRRSTRRLHDEGHLSE